MVRSWIFTQLARPITVYNARIIAIFYTKMKRLILMISVKNVLKDLDALEGTAICSLIEVIGAILIY
jgi:hypothetical protein